MKIEIRFGLPFVSALIHFQSKSIEIENVLLDTGSAGSVFAVDCLLGIGVKPEPEDMLCRIVGVGGAEYVFSKTLDRVDVGGLIVKDCLVEVGALDYGFEVQGIIGLDFLLETHAIVDLDACELKVSA